MESLKPITLVDPGRQYRGIQTRATAKVWCLIDGQVVMLKLNDGSFKIPGGGVKAGETELEALGRELREECGIEQTSIPELMLHLDEFKPDKFDPDTVFHISTNLDCCEASEFAGSQSLDEYETSLGMQPVLCDVGDLSRIFKPTEHDWFRRDLALVQAMLNL